MDYQTYLASREWALKREAVRKRSGNKCERCKIGPQDAVHHKTYANVGNEPLDDLQAICSPCHEFLSGKSHYDPMTPVAEPLDDLNDNPANWKNRYADGWPINYCRFDCLCGKNRLGIFINIKMWDASLDDDEFFEMLDKSDCSFILRAGQVRCDHCGKAFMEDGKHYSTLLPKGSLR